MMANDFDENKNNKMMDSFCFMRKQTNDAMFKIKVDIIKRKNKPNQRITRLTFVQSILNTTRK